jgi:hypothetical protein
MNVLWDDADEEDQEHIENCELLRKIFGEG